MKHSAFSLMLLLTVAVAQAEENSVASVEVAPVETNEPEPQYESEGISIPPASAEEPFAELSVDRAASYLDEGAIAWTREKQCITCHTNGTYLFIRPALTSSLGPPSDEVRNFFLEQLTTLQDTEPMQLQEGTRPAQLIYLAAGLAQWDAHVSGVLSDETAAALQLMLHVQNEDGAWGSMDCWPPFESSAYQEATMAAMALTASPDWLAAITDEFAVERVERLRTYLRETVPPHDYARVLKLWASGSFNGILEQDEHEQIVSMILQKQRDDGGWNMRDFALPEEWGGGNRAEKLRTELQQAAADSETVTTMSDGHMTGLALIVLQQTDASESAEAVQRGVAWIRRHQRESGRWWTRSLNTDGPHFITFSGTAYPLLALQLFERK
jgi:squalene-hopene/tetraprenyl-beta-curcumene cyclase